MFETALDPDEIIVKVEFPIPDKSGYAKFPNPASRYAIVGVFVSSLTTNVRVSITGAASCVFRQLDYENVLSRSFLTPDLAHINIPSDELNTDLHASAEYRAHLIHIMTCRAVASANGEIT